MCAFQQDRHQKDNTAVMHAQRNFLVPKLSRSTRLSHMDQTLTLSKFVWSVKRFSLLLTSWLNMFRPTANLKRPKMPNNRKLMSSPHSSVLIAENFVTPRLNYSSINGFTLENGRLSARTAPNLSDIAKISRSTSIVTRATDLMLAINVISVLLFRQTCLLTN